jgi:hypothetical protein
VPPNGRKGVRPESVIAPHRRPWWRGVRGPPSIPVLAIVGSDDPYHQNPGHARLSTIGAYIWAAPCCVE